MKANASTNPVAPSISIHENVIIMNGTQYQTPILIEKEWEPSPLHIQSITEWMTHSRRLDSLQVIAYGPNQIPMPHIIDIFWENKIGVDYLPLSSAMKQISFYLATNEDYQLLILPNL